MRFPAMLLDPSLEEMTDVEVALHYNPPSSSPIRSAPLPPIESMIESMIKPSAIRTTASQTMTTESQNHSQDSTTKQGLGNLFIATSSLCQNFLFHITVAIHRGLMKESEPSIDKLCFIEKLFSSIYYECSGVMCKNKVKEAIDCIHNSMGNCHCVEKVSLKDQKLNFQLAVQAANIPVNCQDAAEICVKTIYDQYHKTVCQVFYNQFDIFTLPKSDQTNHLNITNALADLIDESCHQMEVKLTQTVVDQLRQELGLLIFQNGILGENEDSGLFLISSTPRKRQNSNYLDGDPSTKKPRGLPNLNGDECDMFEFISNSPSHEPSTALAAHLESTDSIEEESLDISSTSTKTLTDDEVLECAIHEAFAYIENCNGVKSVTIRDLLRHWPHDQIKKELKEGAQLIVYKLIESYQTGEPIHVEEAEEFSNETPKGSLACTMMIAICWKDRLLMDLGKKVDDNMIHAAFITNTPDPRETLKVVKEEAIKRQSQSIPLYSPEGVIGNKCFPLVVWIPREDSDFFNVKRASVMKSTTEIQLAMISLATSVFMAICTNINFSVALHKRLKQYLPKSKPLFGLNDGLGLNRVFDHRLLPLITSYATAIETKSMATTTTYTTRAMRNAPRASTVSASTSSINNTPKPIPKVLPKPGKRSTIDYEDLINSFLNTEEGLKSEIVAYGAGGIRTFVKISNRENILMPMDRYKTEGIKVGDYVHVKMIRDPNGHFTKDGTLKGARVLFRKSNAKQQRWIEYKFTYSEKGGALWIQHFLKEGSPKKS